MVVSKKKNLGRVNSDVEPNKLVPPSVNNKLLKRTELELQHKEMALSSEQSNKKSNRKEVLFHKNENPLTIKSITDSKSLSEQNKTDSEIQSPQSFSVHSSKPLNDSDSGYQIHEISSTGDDQVSHLHLLNIFIFSPNIP